MTSQSPKCDAAPLESEPEYADNPEPPEGERGSFSERPLRPTGGALAKTVTTCNMCVEIHFDGLYSSRKGEEPR